MLRLADRWMWDFWLADDGAAHHVFYLQAPRALGDPDLRHANATIGHAVSHDLRSWRVLPDALGPGRPGDWDDRATWTGSVVRRDGTWWMFYTGTSTVDGGAVQRIGVATSTDLLTWRRHPCNPLIEASPPWYEAVPTTMWPDVSWRDPFVVLSDGHARCFLTARASDGPADGRGAIATATSSDLEHWTVAAPAYAPTEFSELEVPQVVDVGAHRYLLFSVSTAEHGRRWRERTGRAPRTATYYVTAESTHGPFTGSPRPIDVGQTTDELYAGKLVLESTGSVLFLAARFHRPGGGFAGELADPVPLVQRADGTLTSPDASEGDGVGEQAGAVERRVR